MNMPNRILAPFLVISLLVFLLISCNGNPYRDEQAKLAKNLGIAIDNYPYESIFPEGYFSTVLNENMTEKEVHNIITGYQKVYKCGNYVELYYYYSSDDGKALRFQIIYSQDFKYQRLQGEDKNSRYLGTAGCIEGRINENSK